VTGVDNSGKLAFMQSLGADHVLDHAGEDYSKAGHRYDRILDFAGKRSVFADRRALADDGIYAMVGGSLPRLLEIVILGWLVSRVSSVDMSLLAAKPNSEDLAHLAGLVEAGTITPAIERTYGLEQVPDALRHLGDDNAKGKLVITT
jgi:NADPH:quinone reductase-like Zn-dependent oxidoreductase